MQFRIFPLIAGVKRWRLPYLGRRAPGSSSFLSFPQVSKFFPQPQQNVFVWSVFSKSVTFQSEFPQSLFFQKSIYPKCVFVKCTQLACLLSIASLFCFQALKTRHTYKIVSLLIELWSCINFEASNEMSLQIRRMFTRADKNKDGKLTQEVTTNWILNQIRKWTSRDVGTLRRVMSENLNKWLPADGHLEFYTRLDNVTTEMIWYWFKILDQN